jgi:hypothetical protein
LTLRLNRIEHVEGPLVAVPLGELAKMSAMREQDIAFVGIARPIVHLTGVVLHVDQRLVMFAQLRAAFQACWFLAANC